MNRLVSPHLRAIVVLAIGFVVFASAQAQSTAADKKAFSKLQHDWAEARKNADLGFLENFYAREFTVGNMDGSESSRTEDLAMFSSGDLKPATIVDDQLVIHVYGQAALVTGVEHLEGSYKGHTGSFDLRFANTFVYRDRRWQLVRHQATQIPPSRPTGQ